MMRIVGGSVSRAAFEKCSTRTGHGIVTNWDDTERNLESHFSLRLS